MKDKKTVILIILGVIAVISLFKGIFAPSKSKRNIFFRQAGILCELKVVGGKVPACLARKSKKTRYSSWPRDPFSASLARIKESGGIVLSGIMWSKDNPAAIIGGRIIRIGDEVSGNTVIDIKPDKVILNDGIRNFELELGR